VIAGNVPKITKFEVNATVEYEIASEGAWAKVWGNVTFALPCHKGMTADAQVKVDIAIGKYEFGVQHAYGTFYCGVNRKKEVQSELGYGPNKKAGLRETCSPHHRSTVSF
jgi:hypothetical protein